MATTASQKLGVLVMPAAALLLAWATSSPEWNPPHEQRSWRETMHPELARGAAVAPPAGEAEEGTGTETAEAPGKPAKPVEPVKPAKPLKPVEPVDPVDPVKPDEPTEPTEPAEPKEPEGLAYKVTGLATAGHSIPLTDPASERLDVHVLTSGAVRLGSTVTDPEMALIEIRTAPREKREKGLLFLVPQARAPWNDVLALAAAGAEAGWQRIGLCVARPDNAAQGRVLLLDLPATEAPTDKALDALEVVVGPGPGGRSTYSFMGEDLENVGKLRAKATLLHKEYEEGFEEGYSENPDETPWSVSGEGAVASGVIEALDVLRDGGVKCVRLAGLRKPTAEDGE